MSADERRGTRLIAAERQRQIDTEGYGPDHDRGRAEELALAGAAYALAARSRSEVRDYLWLGASEPDVADAWPEVWPWDEQWWKPSPDDRVRELTKAGALIAAAIDSLIREQEAGK